MPLFFNICINKLDKKMARSLFQFARGKLQTWAVQLIS